MTDAGQLVRCLLDAETAKGFFARRGVYSGKPWNPGRVGRDDRGHATFWTFVQTRPEGDARMFKLKWRGEGWYSLSVYDQASKTFVDYGDPWQATTVTHAQTTAKRLADEYYLGVGDNPNEAADDAIDSAAQSGWLVDKIVNDFPDLPSAHAYSMEGVRDETKREILRRKPELADDEQQLELEINAELEDYDNDSDLNYYVILWVRGKQPVYPDYGAPEPPPPVAEAETAKEFIKRITDLAPPASFGKKKFRWKREYDPRTGSLSNYERRRVPGIRSTQFRRYAPGEYSVRYHNTDVLRFNRQGSAVTDTGGYSSKTTFDRMNSHLPHGWRIYRYQGTRYWTNQRWPEEIRDEVFSIRTRRRPPRESAYMIPYGRGDWIDKRGNLYTQNGHLVITPAGTTTGPEPPQEVQEGRYQQRLDWINRVRKKHEKMKEIGKLERELEKVEEPDRRKKRMNLH